jgi:hypothetical protein
MQTLQPKEGLKEDLMYFFTFSGISKAEILITILCTCFKNHICECFNFSTYNFKTNMDKNIFNYLQTPIFRTILSQRELKLRKYVVQHLI